MSAIFTKISGLFSGMTNSNTENSNELNQSSSSTATFLVEEKYTPKNQKMVLLLDESGSMSQVKNDMIGSINQFIYKQQNLKTDDVCSFSFITFNNKVKVVIDDKPLKEVLQLNTEDYEPNGMTALYDAMGEVFDKFKTEKSLIFVIVTDGEENSSREYNRKTIMSLIDEYKKDEHDWNFVYLASDVTVSQQGTNLGMAESDLKCTNRSTGYENMSSNLSAQTSDAISSYRMKITKNIKLAD
jgi:hypothetical protein